MTRDEKFMQLALNEAIRGVGHVAPNPMVGALVVKNQQVLGVGYHQKYGEAHAEVNAIHSAKMANCQGATIYVTLEPCSTYGKTPPCTELIIKSGISRVVIGTLDPNPAHAGEAIKIFENANIEVTTSVLEQDCQKINESFFKYIQTQLPLVTLKMAMTLDGKIACQNGESKWITSEIARERVQFLRKNSEAILVGANTIRFDHPTLYPRNSDGTIFSTKLKRFVASNSLTINELKKLYPVDTPQIIELNSRTDWDKFLQKLGKDKITSLLIEGGGELAASALENQAVDIVEFHIAPKILGGANSKTVVAGHNPTSLSEAINLYNQEIIQLGSDFAIRGKCK